VAPAEIYDAGSGAGSRLVNVSSRGAAGSGGDALITGFVTGNGCVGARLVAELSGLAKFGATGVVADPSVALFDSKVVPWAQTTTGPEPATIPSAALTRAHSPRHRQS
jgi:hypothetical protein